METKRSSQRIDEVESDPFAKTRIRDPKLPQTEHGRTGLAYSRCQYPYRPKFMCPKKSCRRSVKPFYDPSRYIYCVDDFGKWEIGPLKREDNAHYDRALAAMIFRLTDEHQPSRKLRRRVMAARYDELDEKIGDGSMEPHQWLKGENWDDWKTLYWHRSTWLKVTVVNGDTGKRCPSCGGGAIRVGSNFRVPGRRDERGWKKVDRLVEEGVNLEARFSPCATFGMHRKMVEKLRPVLAG